MSPLLVIIVLISAAAFVVLIIFLIIHCAWQKQLDHEKERLVHAKFSLKTTAARCETEYLDVIGCSANSDPPALLLPCNVSQPYGLASVDRRCELPINDLRFEELLGVGEFGIVYRCSIYVGVKSENRQTVAVKTAKNRFNPIHVEMILDEYYLMRSIEKHPNVLQVLAGTTINFQLHIVSEFCELGSLKNFLLQYRDAPLRELWRKVDSRLLENTHYSTTHLQIEQTTHEQHSTYVDRLLDNNVSMLELLWYGYQTANGMDYLAKKQILHRDLAARNLLLTGEKVVKIADYGLARHKGYYHVTNQSKSSRFPMPLWWMAPESLSDRRFLPQSDVWSFGVVLWEIFSLGEDPFYDNIKTDDEQCISRLFQALVNGKRLRRPTGTPDGIFSLMNRCWSIDAVGRPSFAQAREDITVELSRCR